MKSWLLSLHLWVCDQWHKCYNGKTCVSTYSAPYLLFANTVCIYRMNLDGSDREELVYEQNKGIFGLEYYYRCVLK